MAYVKHLKSAKEKGAIWLRRRDKVKERGRGRGGKEGGREGGREGAGRAGEKGRVFCVCCSQKPK